MFYFATLALLLTSVSKAEINLPIDFELSVGDMYHLFTNIDTDSNGYLSLNEFISEINTYFTDRTGNELNQEDIATFTFIFHVAANGDDKIYMLEWSDFFNQVFDRIDADNNGSINFDEIF